MKCEYIIKSLERLLSYRVGNEEARNVAEHLFLKYGSLDRILSADVNILYEDEKVGGEAAFLIKLASSLISRAKTESYKFGIKHTPEETDRYFKALLLPRSVECVYAMSYDAKGRAVGADLLSEGVVNASEILPRKVIEAAKRRGAKYMILAHNHPHGTAEASEDDISSTMSIARILANSDVKLARHIIVSGTDVTSIMIGGDL